MLIVIALMLAGVAVGLLLRKRRLGVVQPAITLLIWLLLFLLGVEVGGNQRIMQGLHTIGLQALVLCLGATMGSVLAAYALWKYIRRQEGGRS